MTYQLAAKSGWQRARAVVLHEHFSALIVVLRSPRAKLTVELGRIARLLDGKLIELPQGGTYVFKASYSTIEREWYCWQRGGRKKNPLHKQRPEALLPNYKPGCGGHRQMPHKLIQEIHRLATAPTGGRDKHKRAPLSVIYQQLCKAFAARRPLPGIDYADYEEGAEFPWSYDTVCRAKPPKTLRAAGNLGRAAHKAISAYVSLNYARLRKGELYTLDDVRLDILCTDEATGKIVEVVCYILMEVGSRSIVAYVMKPAAAIRQEDVDELLAYALQTEGYGIGIGYTTHIKFERGTVACSEAAQMVLEGVTEGRIKVHRTSMVGGIRWIGSPRDKSSGNAAGKAVIESFNRRLHHALLHLPGQRGNNFGNAPASLGYEGAGNLTPGSLAAEAQKLAQANLASGGRLRLKLPMLYLMELNACVREAIRQLNHEPDHAYQGHGKFHQAEVRPGVWQDVELSTPTL